MRTSTPSNFAPQYWWSQPISAWSFVLRERGDEMRDVLNSTGRGATTAIAGVLLMVCICITTARAEVWNAAVGAQSRDLGSQALAFLPNELWIHAGDSIRWTHASTEIHTVTFLTPGEIRPPNFGMTFGIPVGCPGVPGGNTPDGASFDNSSCVNSGILGKDGNIGTGLEAYSVSFPT